MRTRNRRQSPSREVNHNVHPALQAALESLDVDLEHELARYRRSRPRPNGGIRRFWVGLSPKSGQPEAVPLPPKASAPMSSGALAATSTEDRQTDQNQPDQPDQSDLEAALTQRPVIAQNSLPDPKQALATESLESVALTQASALLKQTQNFANPGATSAENLPSPETYAFPSVREQRQLARTARRRSRGWLSGTGVATILMMMAGTLWTYYANYPDSDQYLQVGQVFKAVGDATGLSALDPTQGVGQGEGAIASTTEAEPKPVVADGPTVPGSELARQEFGGLDLERLSVFERPRPQPKKPEEQEATVLANATLGAKVPQGPVGTDETTSGAKKAIAKKTEPKAEKKAESPKAAPKAQEANQKEPKQKEPKQKENNKPPAIETIPEDGTRYFYVVERYKTSNAGDEENLLAQARQFVPSAYVRTLVGDRYIQFGALEEQGRAERLAKWLQSEGLTIRILHPTQGSETAKNSTSESNSDETKKTESKPDSESAQGDDE